jgi:hypothetical protein
VGHRAVAVGAENGVAGGAEGLCGGGGGDRADAGGADVGHLASRVLGGVDLGGQCDRERPQLLGVHLVERALDGGLIRVGDQRGERSRLLGGEFAIWCSRLGGPVLLVVDEPKPPSAVVWSGHRGYHLS